MLVIMQLGQTTKLLVLTDSNDTKPCERFAASKSAMPSEALAIAVAAAAASRRL